MTPREALSRGVSRARQTPFFSDLAATSAAQVVSVLLNACSLAVISRRFGAFDLGLYTLERRNMALLQPVVLLGLSVATPRYIALSLGRESNDASAYAVSGAGLVVAATALLGGVILAFPEPVAEVAFGDSQRIDLARALGGFVLATAFFQMVYSVCRGYMHIARANVLELMVVGVLPLVLGAVGPTNVVSLMWILNGAILTVTIIVAVSEPDLRRAPAVMAQHALALRQKATELLRFGIARTPGDMAVVGLFAIPPIAVVHWAGATEAGYTSIVVSSLNIVSVAAVPLGVLLLPRVAFDAGRPEGIPFEKYVLLGEATLDVAVAFSGVMFVASPLLIAFWLPDAPGDVVTAAEVAALGLPGYVFYLVFRSYLDGIEHRPLSSAATISGLLCLAVVLPGALATDVWSPPLAASVSLLVSLTVAGGVTFWLVRKRIPGFVSLRSLTPVALWLLAVAPLGVVTRTAALPIVGIATAIAAITCAAGLLVVRRAWLIELGARAGFGGSG